jgi:hypothetical protein
MPNIQLAWLIALLTYSVQVLADDSGSGYQLGRGYTLGDSGIHLGGYANAQMHSQGPSPTGFSLEDLSLFVSWDNGSKLRYFSETEVEDGLSIKEGQSLTTGLAKFRM